MTEITSVRVSTSIDFTVPDEIRSLELERGRFGASNSYILKIDVFGNNEEALRETIEQFKESLVGVLENGS